MMTKERWAEYKRDLPPMGEGWDALQCIPVAAEVDRLRAENAALKDELETWKRVSRGRHYGPWETIESTQPPTPEGGETP